MKKIIAIPLVGEVLSEHFGHCQHFALVTVENNKILSETKIVPPEHQPGLYPRWIAQQGAKVVLAGGMGQQAITLFNQQGIDVFVGAPAKSAKELVNDFLAGNLTLNANCCNHDEEQADDHCKH